MTILSDTRFSNLKGGATREYQHRKTFLVQEKDAVLIVATPWMATRMCENPCPKLSFTLLRSGSRAHACTSLLGPAPQMEMLSH